MTMVSYIKNPHKGESHQKRVSNMQDLQKNMERNLILYGMDKMDNSSNHQIIEDITMYEQINTCF